MKSTKKIIAIILVFVFAMAIPVSASALSLDSDIADLKAQFIQGEGPIANGYSVDYRYFSPVKENDGTKYPLVVWLHGMGDGSSEGVQVQKSDIAKWASDEFQGRFKNSGGAFILAARSREELGFSWDNEMIEPLYAAIYDFAIRNIDHVDLTRIYIGGYSMGGKMTLKMTIAYPEMFAAAFPICPAWSPSEDLTSHMANIPVWLTSSTLDPLVNYYFSVTPTWENIVKTSSVPEKCRFSTIDSVCYPDGTPTSSAHHTWFAVNHDMFTTDNSDYYNMSTVTGTGEAVKLTHPDGMISWLSEHTSEFDGVMSDGTGNITPEDSTDNIVSSLSIIEWIIALVKTILKMIIG